MNINLAYSESNLSKNIKELGFILGDVVKEQEGVGLFNTVEKLRALTKVVRVDLHAKSKIKRIVGGLDLNTSHNVIKAFSIYFILFNAADEVHKIVIDKLNEDKTGTNRIGSFRESFNQIKSLALTKKNIRQIISRIEIHSRFYGTPNGSNETNNFKEYPFALASYRRRKNKQRG